MMLCSSAYAFMKSPISSRLMLVFLKMGHISLNFSFKCSGTRISTSTQPNKRSFHLAQNSLRAHNLDGIQGSSYFGGNESL